MITETLLAARAAAGAKMLDFRRPGWAGRVDIGRLDMRDGCRDVLSQAGYGRWPQSLDMLGLSIGDAIRLGLDLPRSTDEEWTWLEAAWAGEIRRRLKAPEVNR